MKRERRNTKNEKHKSKSSKAKNKSSLIKVRSHSRTRVSETHYQVLEGKNKNHLAPSENYALFSLDSLYRCA